MDTKIETLSDLTNAMIQNPQLQEEFKKDPVQAITGIDRKSPLDWDKWIYRLVVFFLGATVLSTVLGVLILMGGPSITDDKHVPTILTAIGSAAIGALAGLLAPSPKSTNS